VRSNYLPALVLYRLLGEVNKTYASLMVILGLASFPLCRECVKRDRCPDAFARADFLSYWASRNAKPWPCCSSICIATGTLSAGSLALAFFFGLLVFKSGFLPRILGVLLIAACFGYLADNLTPLLLPSYGNLVGRIANIR